MDESLGPFNLALLALPGIALKIAVRIMYGRRAYAVADPLKILLSVAGTLLIVLAILGATIGLVGLWWTLIPIVIVFGIALLLAFDRHRQGEHRALVWTLAAAAERGIPLPEAARALADESQDDTGARSLALAQALEQGRPLSQAVGVARLRLSTPIAVAIRLGEALGLLGPAMRQQLQDASDVDAMLRRVTIRFFYLFLVILAFVGALTYMSLRTIPAFERMFSDFGIKLPAMTQVLIEGSNWFIRVGWLITLPVTLALAIVALAILFQGLLSIVGWVPRDLPLVWRFFKRYDGAIVMRGLALTVRRGLPLPDGLRLLAATYPIRRIGRQLAIAHARVMQGADWRQSLLIAGLITRTDAAVLSAAERVGNLPWALEEMADSTLRRQLYGMQALMQLLYPVLVLLAGALVGYFVIGMFLPLISLVQGLS